MPLSRAKVLQTIKDGKRTLHIEDVKFIVRYAQKPSKVEKHAEIFIWSNNEAEIVLYPTARFFSVRHELCHAKLFRMGFPLTNTERDLELFPYPKEFLRMVVMAEWYINELQKRVFNEYYAIDEAGTPRPQPFPEMPPLPKDRFTVEEIAHLTVIAKKKNCGC